MKRNTCFIAAIMFAMVLLTASGVFASEQNYYVTENGAGNYDGGSWANALKGTELAARLQKAQAGDIFYVAKGTYKPGTKNSDSFTLKKGVKLYGGFVGNEAVDELSVAGRNFRTNETVLSGKVDNSTNSKTVIKTGDSCDSSSLIDGFTISDGQNNSSFGANGGGMEIKGSPTVKNCLIKDNSAKGNGGGVLVASSIGTPVIEFCTFKSNTANNGGGVYVSDGEAKISNCTFESNTAKKDDWSTGGYGGGVYAGKKVRIVNCTFCGNDSDVSGNGFYNGSDFSSIMSSTFYRRAGNAKTELFSSKSITVTNSIFWSDEDDSIIDGNGNRTVSY
ncbi:MAG: hypothetical protein RR214_01305, partial [Synergistaceae bacterium]